ncbi:MAG: hypothetical protein QXQ39_05845, partial [Conexivisphaerales archaeon]
IQALDMLEVIAKKKAHLMLLEDMRRLRDGISHGRDTADMALNKMEDALSYFSSDEPEAQFYSKDVLTILGNGIATIMLLEIGTKLGIERFLELGRLYAIHFLDGKPYPADAMSEAKSLFEIDKIAQVVTNA